MKMKSIRTLAPIAALILTACAAWAQDTASITGTVTDPSGAAIPNAQVALKNTEHGINRSGASNSSGDFLFASLPIGSYDLIVTAEGFKKYEAKGVLLQVAEKARANVPLQVGAINTEVVVQGSEVAQVETQSSDLGGTVTGKEITQLELNGRNFTQLITLVPGVTNQSGQDEAQVGVNGNVAFSVNGGRTEYNNWEMDGGDALDNGSNTSLNVYPSIDAIAEFKVETSNYGAQYGNQVRHQPLPRRSVRIRPQRRFQRHSVFLAERSCVQEKRFRRHYRGPDLYPGRLQQRQAEDVLFLVGGVAAGDCTERILANHGSFSSKPRGKLQRRLRQFAGRLSH
jgi:hypothetical protein